jgi:predicted aconitase with swiveling domain
MMFDALRVLTCGSADGPVALLSAPLSLWGGFDLETGAICDVNHPEHGLSLAGKILAMRMARGSSSSSSALVEASRRGVAPSAIILAQADPILAIGSLVAADLYGIEIPILLLPNDQWDLIPAVSTAVVQARDKHGSIDIKRAVDSLFG